MKKKPRSDIGIISNKDILVKKEYTILMFHKPYIEEYLAQAKREYNCTEKTKCKTPVKAKGRTFKFNQYKVRLYI